VNTYYFRHQRWNHIMPHHASSHNEFAKRWSWTRLHRQIVSAKLAHGQEKIKKATLLITTLQTGQLSRLMRQCHKNTTRCCGIPIWSTQSTTTATTNEALTKRSAAAPRTSQIYFQPSRKSPELPPSSSRRDLCWTGQLWICRNPWLQPNLPQFHGCNQICLDRLGDLTAQPHIIETNFCYACLNP